MRKTHNKPRKVIKEDNSQTLSELFPDQKQSRRPTLSRKTRVKRVKKALFLAQSRSVSSNIVEMFSLVSYDSDGSSEGDQAPNEAASASATQSISKSSAGKTVALNILDTKDRNNLSQPQEHPSATSLGEGLSGSSLTDAKHETHSQQSPYASDESSEHFAELEELIEELKPVMEAKTEAKSVDVQERIMKFSDWSKQGYNFTQELSRKKDFGNPYLLQKVVEYFGIADTGSNHMSEISTS